VFENRVKRRIFVPKKDEVTGGGIKLHNEELRNLYSSPSIIRIIKPRRMRWVGYLARMVGRGMHIVFFVGKPEGRRPLGRKRCRWVLLRWILERKDRLIWTGLLWLSIGTSGGFL
jgi:hypothetical protein